MAHASHRQAVPKGQGHRSIQIQGSRVACERRQARTTSTDLHRRSGRAHGRIQPSLVSMVVAQPLRAASVEGIYKPKLHSQH